MSDWYYLVSERKVVDYKPRSLAALGPYKTKAEAEKALKIVKERNISADDWDAE